MRNRIPSKIFRLLPWYVNGTLSAREKRVVEQYLCQHPDVLSEVDAYRQYQSRMKSWEKRQPSSKVYANALGRARIPQERKVNWFHPYAWGAALVILVLLWSVVRPGVLLEWSSAGGGVNEFYIYRTAETGEFERIGTVPVRGDVDKYVFVDTRLLPWESYTYVVQGVRGDDVRALSGSVQRDALAVLPVQIMLLATSLLLGYILTGWLSRFPARVGGMGVLAS